jgi:acetylornithine deacetylase/succinyl-diaminopimelate desuccinylase-like protein
MDDASAAVAGAAGGLSERQLEWRRDAWAAITADELRDLLKAIVDIPSPTGDEAELATWLVDTMRAAGLQTVYQPIDDRQGNALGWVPGRSRGADLLLFAPIDTHLAGSPERDGPWAGPGRPDLVPRASVDGDVVVGLGAENPKAFATCVLGAALAIHRAGIPLSGTLRVGLCAGGMPTNERPTSRRRNLGQGVGCSFMLEQGFRAAGAIIAKPGWAVAWEEVGLCWFRVTTRGRMNYTGIRHFRPYRNPIVDMAAVVDGLECWFPEYTAANSSGLVAPQGSIGAVEGGWPYKPAFVPATCDAYVDLRVSPRVDVQDVHRQLSAALDRIAAGHPGLEVASEMILAIPGTWTPPDSQVVRATIAAWEAVAGRAHQPPARQSGASDANILRGRGIPTARVGLPPVPGLPYADEFSMGVAHSDAMLQLTRVLVHAALDLCTEPGGER